MWPVQIVFHKNAGIRFKFWVRCNCTDSLGKVIVVQFALEHCIMAKTMRGRYKSLPFDAYPMIYDMNCFPSGYLLNDPHSFKPGVAE